MRLKLQHEIRFDRNEFAGAFGDIGTDLPLIMGMLIAGQLDVASVLVMFGLTQMLTGLWYGLPMPVQPLKVVAALVIAHHIPGPVIYGAGLALGIVMFLLTITRWIDGIARFIPKAVVRGIQFGLGLKLALLAVNDYMVRDGIVGYALAGIALCVLCILWKNRRWPASLVVIGLGAVYALSVQSIPWGSVFNVRLALPVIHPPAWPDIVTGFFILALPQIPLSIGNSILATSQLVEDLYPNRKIPVRNISVTYGIMNIVNALMGGIPVCHGSGGMAGHYTFGARTGGSVIVYGAMFLAVGLFLSDSFFYLVQIFPFPILGVILFFEGLTLMRLVRDLADNRFNLFIALTVGVLANSVPYGFLIGLMAGTIFYYGWQKMSWRK